MKTKILLVDDHQLVREGLRLLLQREADLEVVGEAGNGTEAMEAAGHGSPDLVLMDVDLGGTTGIEVTRQMLSRYPQIRILVLSALPDPGVVDGAIRAGAKGYLLKMNAHQELIRSIRMVMNGHFYLCPQVSNLVIQQLFSARPGPAKPHLTDRELDVLKLTAEGLRVKDIAARLNIGVKTVETHRSSLMKKVGCGSSAELTRHAIREGICPA